MGALNPAARLAAALLLTAVLAAALAACGGDDGDGGDGSGGPLTVNSNRDTNERDGELTLREAILLATGGLAAADLDSDEAGQVDGSPGPDSADEITFAVSLPDGNEIALELALPPLSTGDDTINGFREGDAEAERVVISGGDSEFTCLELSSGNNALRGLELTGCHTAVLVKQDAAGNHIGGAGRGEGNVISGNVVGIQMDGHANFVQGNYIGVDRLGKEALGNEFEGIWVSPAARGNTIGGAAPGEGNVISGNPLFGISIDGSPDNVVQGNLIGLDSGGAAAIANQYGINIQAGATGNVIGGSREGERNVISGNNSGVILRDAGTTNNTVTGNYFSTSIDGATEVRNAVDIFENPGVGENVIEPNRIGPD
jgi:hypothetical protein